MFLIILQYLAINIYSKRVTIYKSSVQDILRIYTFFNKINDFRRKGRYDLFNGKLRLFVVVYILFTIRKPGTTLNTKSEKNTKKESIQLN